MSLNHVISGGSGTQLDINCGTLYVEGDAYAPQIPTTGVAIANKAYVDAKSAEGLDLKVNRAGDEMTGDLNMGANRVQTTQPPLFNHDLTNKTYVDTGDAARLPLTGGTLTGPLTMDNANIDLTNGSVIQENGINTYQSLQPVNATNIITGSTAPNKTAGFNSSAYGWLSLDSSQTGENNTACGAVSLKNLTTGARNTAVGMSSGGSFLGTDITIENDNVLLGYGTSGIGYSNSITIGSGGQASKSNQCTIHGVTEIVSGFGNTCDIGSSTRRMKDVHFNGTIYRKGVETDQIRLLPNNNLGISTGGVFANISTGNGNFAIGAGALYGVTTGVNNLALGTFSGEGITGGSDNISIGPNSNITLNSGNNVVIGCSTTVDGGNYNTILGCGSNNNGGGGFYNYGIVLGAFTQLTASYQARLGGGITHLVAGNNICDIGTAAEPFKDLYLGGQVNGLTPVGGVWSSTTTAATMTGTTELTIVPPSGVGSLVVPADGFKVGDAYHLVISGTVGAALNETITLRVYGGPSSNILIGQIVHQFGGAVVPATSFFEIEVDFSIPTIGAPVAAAVRSNFDFTYNKPGPTGGFEGSRIVYTNSSSFDTTDSNVLNVTAQWGTGNGSNSITTQMMYLTKRY